MKYSIENLTRKEKEIINDELEYARQCKEYKKLHEKFLKTLPPISDDSIRELNDAIAGVGHIDDVRTSKVHYSLWGEISLTIEEAWDDFLNSIAFFPRLAAKLLRLLTRILRLAQQ